MFDFGASKSRSNSQSSSYGYQQSFSDSLSRGVSRSDQRVAFEDIFQNLYAGASGATAKAAEMLPLFQGQAADLYSGGASILDSLGVGAGEDYLQSRLTDTTVRDAQLGALQSGLGSLFRDELNPAISSKAVAAGQLGGGRQGVAQGVAVGKIANQYQQGAAAILGQDQAQRDQAASALMQGRTQAAGTALSAIPGLLGVAQAGLGAPQSIYQALAGILGGPTVLGSSSSEDFATALSRAIGEDRSQSSSSSKGSSFSFGI